MITYHCTIQDLLSELVDTEGGSDLIVTVGRPPMMRIFGEILQVSGHPVLTKDDTEALCLAVLNETQIERFLLDKEIDLAYELEDIGRFRVNIFRQRGTICLVARVVMDEIPNLEELGLPPVVSELAKLKSGLVIFAGPTGQGKSTSVASMIDYINKHRPCHIVTIEDPIEYVHKHRKATVEQREVGIDTESFHAALRRVLRQAPDVILIGEIRDTESARAAMTLVETGHLILTTLHTSGAIATVNRLIDIFPPEQERQMRVQFSASLAAVVWQQLIPARDKNGLVLACEVLIAIPAVRSLIRQGRTHEIMNIIQTGRKYGMFAMEQSVEELMNAGKVDPEWFKSNYFDMATK